MHWELMWIIIYPSPLAVWQNSVQKTVSPPRLHVELHIHIVNFFNAVKLRWMDWYIEISIRWILVSEFKVLWKIGSGFSSNLIHDLFISIALCNHSHWLHICELISNLLTWQVVRLYESKYDEQNNPDRYLYCHCHCHMWQTCWIFYTTKFDATFFPLGTVQAPLFERAALSMNVSMPHCYFH